ncbi:MAG: hypothetical protein ACYTHN_17695, partial [Planctomycetota bacterium]
FIPFGDREDNVRISAFAGAWGGWWDAEASLFVKVDNPTDAPRACRVFVQAAGKTYLEKELNLAGHGGFETTFTVTRPEMESVFIAEVSPGGALDLDDRAWCRVPGRERKRVFLVSDKPTAFVQSAIRGLEELMDKERSGLVGSKDWRTVMTPQDVAVFEGTGPGTDVPKGGFLVLGGGPEELPGPPPGPETHDAAVIEWDAKHPVTQGLTFDGVFFHRCRPLPETYHPLVMTDKGPVVGAREGKDWRMVLLSASLADTNLGLVSAFPIFVRNALRWVGGDDVPGMCPHVHPGCRHPPKGYTITWETGKKGGPGVAVLRKEGKGTRVAVNFTHEGESTLTAPAEKVEETFPIPEAKAPGMDPWRWFIWAGLIILALDWALLFGRRR